MPRCSDARSRGIFGLVELFELRSEQRRFFAGFAARIMSSSVVKRF
jgi:hypothetical protein